MGKQRRIKEIDLIFAGVSWAFFMIILNLWLHPFGDIVAGVTLLIVAYRIGKYFPKK